MGTSWGIMFGSHDGGTNKNSENLLINGFLFWVSVSSDHVLLSLELYGMNFSSCFALSGQCYSKWEGSSWFNTSPEFGCWSPLGRAQARAQAQAKEAYEISGSKKYVFRPKATISCFSKSTKKEETKAEQKTHFEYLEACWKGHHWRRIKWSRDLHIWEG